MKVGFKVLRVKPEEIEENALNMQHFLYLKIGNISLKTTDFKSSTFWIDKIKKLRKDLKKKQKIIIFS